MIKAMHSCRAVAWSLAWAVLWNAVAAVAAPSAAQDHCDYHVPGQRNVYWGDLHVHTAYSLDAYVFGSRHDPGDAFAFARGQALTLADGRTRVQLERPLDFTAVTDHAETFNIMYMCTDPLFQDNKYCRGMRNGSKGDNLDSSLRLFSEYLLTLLDASPLAPPPLCKDNETACVDAANGQWRRSQAFANAADQPCTFSAFIGNEWSATPNSQHWHRNLIFAGTAVTPTAIDYIRYPSLEQLWNALETQCLPDAGCEAIAIPHNSNLANGGGFDITEGSPELLRLRAKYERLLEVHQIKGNSECLPGYGDSGAGDCDFEILASEESRDGIGVDSPAGHTWEKLRASYARSVLKRGLQSSAWDKPPASNPLRLGLIGSTDTHVATPGAVAEDRWKGDTRNWGDSAAFRLQRPAYNPGGLVAVWAEENTRASVFAALQRREVYATSGPRIGLKFLAHRGPQNGSCENNPEAGAAAVMGGQLNSTGTGKPRLTVLATMDKTPLARVDIIKANLRNEITVESVTPVFNSSSGSAQICISWVDEDFDAAEPAFWYARVLEVPSPRWSRFDCEQVADCTPAADKMIQERAWASPIWYVP